MSTALNRKNKSGMTFILIQLASPLKSAILMMKKKFSLESMMKPHMVLELKREEDWALEYLFAS